MYVKLFKAKKFIYRFMFFRIMSTKKVTHRKLVVVDDFPPIVKLKKRSAFKK